MKPLSQSLGEFVAEARFESLPGSAVEAAKIRLLDVLGAALAAHRVGRHKPLAVLLNSEEGPATTWGGGKPASIRDATLFNTFLAHALYQEDGSRYTGGHPASVVIPGAFAFAQATAASGKDLIVGILVGYEVFLRLGRAIYPSLLDRGFQSTAVLAAVSCAAAASRLLGSDAKSAQNAISIACSLGVGLKASGRCSESQPLQVAHSAQGGAIAAQLAHAGLPGAIDIVEQGFFPAFAADYDAARVATGLGQDFLIDQTYLKLHGGCRGNHAPIDTWSDLIEKHTIDTDQIETIHVWVDTATYEGEVDEPKTGEQAQYSIAFALATRSIFGDSGVFRYSDESVNDPRVAALMQRITVDIDPQLDKSFPDERGARVIVRLRNGEQKQARRSNAVGEPEFPVSSSQIERKFRGLVGASMPSEGAQIIDFVSRLEDADSIGRLGAMLRLNK